MADEDVPPSNANEDCVGPKSEQAGKASGCAGCPNQQICASGAATGPDPDLPQIQERMSLIRHKVVVLSGKGGVGKSTVTAQLAHAFVAKGFKVGVLDADVCGPSIPKILGVESQSPRNTNTGLDPVWLSEVQDLGVMSLAFLVSPEDAIVWRGPKKNGFIKKCLRDTEWGALDILLIDTPPGTTDEHLSIHSYLKDCGLDGAIVVTTPQEVSLQDVRKEIAFCKKVDIKVIGVVENMSGFVCPNCQGESVIFRPTSGGAAKLCADLELTLLASLPLDPRMAQLCDKGKAFLTSYPSSPCAVALERLVEAATTILDMEIDDNNGDDDDDDI